MISRSLKVIMLCLASNALADLKSYTVVDITEIVTNCGKHNNNFQDHLFDLSLSLSLFIYAPACKQG